MRLYVYIDKEIIKRLAANIPTIHFDIDFFEYSEKRGYTIRDDISVHPEFDKKMEEKDKCKFKVNFINDKGCLSNVEVFRRYINIEDVSDIKNNNFYYSIIEAIEEDERITKKCGLIDEITEDYIVIEQNKYIINSEAQNEVSKLFEHQCYIELLGYRINGLKAKYGVFKTIAIYIE